MYASFPKMEEISLFYFTMILSGLWYNLLLSLSKQFEPYITALKFVFSFSLFKLVSIYDKFLFKTDQGFSNDFIGNRS